MITAHEDGSFMFLGENLSDAIANVKYSRTGASYFETPSAGNDVRHSDTAGVSVRERAAALSGLTIEEFSRKPPEFQHAAAREIEGDVGYTWNSNVRAPAYAGLDPKTLANMSIDERLAAANDAYFKAVELSKPGSRK